MRSSFVLKYGDSLSYRTPSKIAKQESAFFIFDATAAVVAAGCGLKDDTEGFTPSWLYNGGNT
jgi:hypothetical protein